MKKLMIFGLVLGLAVAPAMAAEDLALTPMTDTELDAVTGGSHLSDICTVCANAATNLSGIGQANFNVSTTGSPDQANVALVIQAIGQSIN